MEIFVGIAIVIISLYFLLKGLTDFVKQLHSFKPKGLLTDGKELNLSLTISASNKAKKEVCERATNSKQDDLD